MQYPWKPHYSHPVAIQNERCFPFWTILADAQPKNAQRLRRFPFSCGQSWIMAYADDHKISDLVAKLPPGFHRMVDIVQIMLCELYVTCRFATWQTWTAKCSFFDVFWFNWQHDQTSCRLVLLRVLSPKDSWGCRELAQANCEDEGWQFWGLEQFQVVDFNLSASG